MQTSFYRVVRNFRTAFISIALTGTFLINVYGQTHPAVYEGDVNKQRLLLEATSQYLYGISQGQIDADSSLLMTCDIYGLSPFLIYSEGYSDGTPTDGSKLLNDKKVSQAKALLTSKKGKDRLQLLLELAGYFLYRPGTAKPDMDEAQRFIQEAIQESDALNLPQWKIEAMRLQAFYQSQLGQGEESIKVINEASRLADQSGSKKQFAQTQLDAAHLLPFGDPLKMANLEKALPLFQALHENEKECGVIGDITTEYFVTKQTDKVEEYLHKNLEAMKRAGYKHHQYVYDVLAYILTLKAEHREAVIYANKSMECMTSKGDSVLAPFFYGRIAGIYLQLYRNEESLKWFDKALAGKTKETRLIWYKAFLGKLLVYDYLRMPTEALALINEIGSEFPPITLFEQMYFTMAKGKAYYMLKNFEQTETHYNAFLSLAEHFPPEYIHQEFPQSLLLIAGFYSEVNKTRKARILLEKSKNLVKGIPMGQALYYRVLFKIDSAEGKLHDAIRDFKMHKIFSDSATRLEQSKAAEELLVKYETEKKDKDILLLKQQGELQQAKLDQSHYARNITFAGAALLLLIAGLLYYLYNTKQKSNKQLTHLLNEKEWLLKEIHHRVKNNLQTVLSLLESQSRQLSNEAFDAIQESQNRVYAMSLIHKKLYQSADVSSISMEDYLRDLIQHLRDSFGHSGKIRFSLELDQVELDVSQAVPIGLIVNEAITNSIKYAFPEDTSSGEIRISFKCEHDKITLLITDNGIGFTNLNDNTKSLGLKLIQGLTDDIDGKLSLQSKPGVEIRVEFVATIPFERLNTSTTSVLQPA